MKKILALFVTLLSCTQWMYGQISWSSPPISLSSGAYDVSDPQVGIDFSGNGVAAWIENGFVKSRNRPSNGNWSAVVTLSDSGASDLQMIVDQNGNATAAWAENGIIKSAFRPFGGSWDMASGISTSNANSPQIAVDQRGDVVAIWIRGGFIESSTKPFGGNWPALPDILATDGADSPQIAIGDDNRTVVAVWHSIVSSVDTVFSASKLITGRWSTKQALSEFSVNPQVAVDSSGNTVAIWYQFQISGPTYKNVILQGATKPFGENWTPSIDISQPGTRNPVDLVARIAFDNAGNAIALWNTSFDDASFAIQSAVLPSNGRWSKPLDIVDLNIFAYDLDISVDSRGDALAIYMLSDSVKSSLKIQSTQSDIGAYNVSWDNPVTLSKGTVNGFPRVATSFNGNMINAAAVWISQTGSHSIIQASTGTGKVLKPPTNLSVKQYVNDFDIFREYYNVLSWQASTSPKVAGYLIFRDGVWISTVGPNVLQYKDHNREQHETGTYGIAAFDKEDFQSLTAKINFPP